MHTASYLLISLILCIALHGYLVIKSKGLIRKLSYIARLSLLSILFYVIFAYDKALNNLSVVLFFANALNIYQVSLIISGVMINHKKINKEKYYV